MTRILQAIFAAIMNAWRDFRRDQAHDAAITRAADAANDLEDLRHDTENADRIARAVDAVRRDGGMHPDPAPGRKPDTRGYRD